MKVYIFDSSDNVNDGKSWDLPMISMGLDEQDRPYAIVENPYFPWKHLRATYETFYGFNRWGVDLD